MQRWTTVTFFCEPTKKRKKGKIINTFDLSIKILITIVYFQTTFVEPTGFKKKDCGFSWNDVVRESKIWFRKKSNLTNRKGKRQTVDTTLPIGGSPSRKNLNSLIQVNDPEYKKKRKNFFTIFFFNSNSRPVFYLFVINGMWPVLSFCVISLLTKEFQN